MDTVGTHVSISEMIEAYAHLVRAREADVEKWQAVHRLAPQLAVAALTAVCKCADPDDLASLLYKMSESPAMLFARLGDGFDYDERIRQVGFCSRKSADAFSVRFPDWFVWVRVF